MSTLACVTAAGAVAVALMAGCASDGGLGRGACPYVRPRLLRLDTDLAHATTEGAAAADVSAVAGDFGQYVKTTLPHGGSRPSDQVVVRFSAALRVVAATVPFPGPDTPARHTLDSAEARLQSECAVHGY